MILRLIKQRVIHPQQADFYKATDWRHMEHSMFEKYVQVLLKLSTTSPILAVSAEEQPLGTTCKKHVFVPP